MWMVTCGEYSDYTVHMVCDTKELAEKWARWLGFDCQVEEVKHEKGDPPSTAFRYVNITNGHPWVSGMICDEKDERFRQMPGDGPYSPEWAGTIEVDASATEKEVTEIALAIVKQHEANH